MFNIFKYTILCCVLSLCVILVSCQNGTNLTEPATLVEQSKSGSAENAVYYQLEIIAKNLLDDRERIASNFSKQLEEHDGEMLFSDFIGNSLAKSMFATVSNDNGDSENVTVELAKHSPPITDPSELRVAIDPEDNSRDKTTVIAYHKDEDGLIVSEQISVQNYNSKTPWPLLLVNSKNHDDAKDILDSGSIGLNKTMAISYLSLTRVQLEATNDWLGSEEYEIYIRRPGGSAQGIVDKNTNWLFDGGTYADAAGRSRTFKDVNDNTTYIMAAPIALVALTSGYIGLQAIEDDNWTGEHWNDRDDNDPTGVKVKRVRTFNQETGSTQIDYIHFKIEEGADDDIYTQGSFYKFTATNTSPSETEWRNRQMDLWGKREDL